MAKELPYFRFTAFEWLNDDISLESYELKGLFIDICSYYWFKDCNITLTMLLKKFSNITDEIDTLIQLEILKDYNDGFIRINFLDKQYDLLSEKRKKRQKAGKKGGLKKSSNAKAMLKQKGSYKDKDKDNNKDKENNKIPFSLFWNKYHEITKKPKTDKEATLNYWNKLNEKEKFKAVDNIARYSKTQNEKRYLKKARTYLADKNFNDEFEEAKINNQNKNKLQLDQSDFSTPDSGWDK